MLQFICIEFFIKMESRAETAVKSEIIFYTTKRGLESADRNEIRMFATMKKLHKEVCPFMIGESQGIEND